MFSKSVADKLEYYVYRLIDPRNGETFYVGKGSGNRVFEHVRGELHAEDDELTDKLKRIREIRKDRFEVAHVIHRHGMSEDQALEVEAALIDAYPEVTNQIGGRSSDERGLMHANQVIERYEAKEATFAHRAIIINVNRTVAESASVYEAVRYAWKLDAKKAQSADIVLAVERGLIIGAFIADQWLEATPQNFPETSEPRLGRWGFVGRNAPKEIAELYLGRRLPDSMRKRGAANPIRYV
ncbi:MAG: LEM-3-like GIY-YIG domain-containing protein [Terracidiphilus sp.]